MCFIKYPDLEVADKYDSKLVLQHHGHTLCHNEAQYLSNLLHRFFYGHIFLCFITFYREIFEARQGFIGSVMRFVEVVALLFYFVLITQGL